MSITRSWATPTRYIYRQFGLYGHTFYKIVNVASFLISVKKSPSLKSVTLKKITRSDSLLIMILDGSNL